LLVPAHSADAAIQALLRQQQGETDAATRYS
jgi:hypothetical protein